MFNKKQFRKNFTTIFHIDELSEEGGKMGISHFMVLLLIHEVSSFSSDSH